MGKKRKYYTAVLCTGEVNMYDSLEEAKQKEGYVHIGDTYPTLIDALEAIKKCAEEDLVHNQKAAKEALYWVEKDREILESVNKRIRETLTGRKRNGSQR